MAGNKTRLFGMCDAYKCGIPVKIIAERFGVMPQAIHSALRRAGVLPPYNAVKPGKPGRPKGGGVPGYTAKRLAISAAKIARKEAGMPPVHSAPFHIDRTPCFKCGTRADVGCKHVSERNAA